MEIPAHGEDIIMMTGTMPPMLMEHAENNLAVPPLVDLRVLLQFCQAVQSYGDSVGSHDEVAARLRTLNATLADLRNLATLCRFAVLGHPHAFQRLADEMHCLSVDFDGPLDDTEGEFAEDEPDTRTDMTAAIDLFAGASFISKGDCERRDRLVVALVHAIEAAIAFPVTFSAEAAAYIGQGTGDISPLFASIVIANATRRLLESDSQCIPLAPRDTRARLECMARRWMRSNPVTSFFDTISGPRIARVVHWEDPARTRPDDARYGDPVTLLLRRDDAEERRDGMEMSSSCAGMEGLAVMFCPHQPAPVLRVVEDGLEVRVPEFASTGPIAVLKQNADFTKVGQVIDAWFSWYPTEMQASIFESVRMDMWAYPYAFGRPILEIAKTFRNGDGLVPVGTMPATMPLSRVPVPSTGGAR
jgi:hypothetical protein